MPPKDTVSGRAIDQIQDSRNSSCDINRRSEERWHLDDPHNKALAALFYTSLFKGAWEMAVHCRESVFSFRRAPNRRSLPESAPGNGNVSAL